MSAPRQSYTDGHWKDRAAEIEEAWMFGTPAEIGRRANPCRHVMRHVRSVTGSQADGQLVTLTLHRCRACGFEEWD